MTQNWKEIWNRRIRIRHHIQNQFRLAALLENNATILVI